MQRFKAFTLIELLIVVAIIAILAAIAVPNFLEAQTRAKVSRVRADMRTIKVGIESYHVDNNRYPDPNKWARNGNDSMTRLPELTTPISYLGTIPLDPFNLHGVPGQIGPSEYVYYTEDIFSTRQVFEMVLNGFGDGAPGSRQWVLFGVGPNGQSNYVKGPYSSVGSIAYDPTNGTISEGDIATWGP